MMRKSLIVAACALGFSGSVFAAEKIELRVGEQWADDYPTTKALREMGELLSQRTNGRITMKVFSNSSLGSEKEMLEQVKIGALDMVRTNISPMNNICPDTVVATLPFLFNSVDHMHKALDGPIGEDILLACQSQGYRGLAFYDNGERSIYSKKPVKSLADVKGMKLRVQPSDLWVAVAHAMGANPTPMPMGEIYTALKTGLVDGAENNIPSYEASKNYEGAKYFSKTGHSMAPEVVWFSKRKWDKLSPEDQKLIAQAAKDSVPMNRKFWAEREQKSLDIVLAAGVQIIEIDKAPFRDAMAPVYAKFVTTPKQKELVNRIREVK